jgi:two-component system, chemotaxis family, chemotaxis protein CheY
MAKILIVDDSETLRTQLRSQLEESGYTVIEGHDGVDGLEKLTAQSTVDLIICDVNMPNMDGLTMVTKVRQNDAWKTIPILMLTTETSADMKAKAKEIGIRAWVTKPYVPEKLLMAIQKVLAK